MGRAVVAVAVLVAGCVPPMVLLRGRNGDIVRCEAGGAMASGYIGGAVSISNCVESYEAIGYRRVDSLPRGRHPTVPLEDYPRRVARNGMVCFESLNEENLVVDTCTKEKL